MGNSLKNQKAKLKLVGITEMFEDGNVDDFQELLNEGSVDQVSICTMRDHDKRTALHLVCMKGHREFFDLLLPLYLKQNIDLDTFDENGDTPLLLACSHGNRDEMELEDAEQADDKAVEYVNNVNKTRNYIINQLLSSGADLMKSVTRRKNNPLHWAFYHGDYETGMTVFNAYPLIVLRNNNRKFIPLEIVFHENLKKGLAKNAKELAKTIVEQFSVALFNNDEEFILKRAKKSEKQQFFAIKKLRIHSTAYDTQKLLAKVDSRGSLSKLTPFVFNKIKMATDKVDEPVDMNQDPKFNKNEEVKLKSKVQVTKHNKVHDVNAGLIKKNDAKAQLNESYDSSSISNDKSKVLIIYDERHTKFLKDKYLRFLHKLLVLAVHVEEQNVIRLLIDNFMVSPFVHSIKGMTAMHYSCTLESMKIAEMLIDINYRYFKSKRKFDILSQLNSGVTKEYNNCAHLACKYYRIGTFEMLFKKGVNIYQYNFQDWKPMDLSKRSYFIEREKKLMNELENKDLLSFNDLTKADSWNPQKMNVVKEDFLYILISRDSQSDYRKTLVYKQLMLLRNSYNGRIVVKYIKPMKDKDNNFYRFYFLINIEEDLMDSIADCLNFEIYNVKKGYVTQFSTQSSKQFSKFRDYHVHSMVNHLFNREFNINHYIKQGIIEAAFPLHEFRNRANIAENWRNERSTVFFDPWKLKPTPKDLRPFNSLAFYFGCDISLYISFTIQYTSFLIFVALIGLAIYLWILISKSKMDNLMTPIIGFIMSIWVTIIYEKWKKREAGHAFIWNTTEYKTNELPRIDYIGDYVIDPIYKNITKKDKFPTFKRRLIVN